MQAVIAQAPSQRESTREDRWWMVSDRKGLDEERPNSPDQFLAEQAEARQVYELVQEFRQIVRERWGDDLAD